jgi:crossover junction endodeoxyribonuclease RusA
VRVSLPWPPRDLHPNARPNRWTLAKRKKAYRIGCAWEAKAAGVTQLGGVSALAVAITFLPPDNRRRDLDGMLSAIKSGLDGLSDVVGVDDSRWEISIKRGEPVKLGRVIIELEEM